jgi:hypothetical protein
LNELRIDNSKFSELSVGEMYEIVRLFLFSGTPERGLQGEKSLSGTPESTFTVEKSLSGTPESTFTVGKSLSGTPESTFTVGKPISGTPESILQVENPVGKLRKRSAGLYKRDNLNCQYNHILAFPL